MILLLLLLAFCFEPSISQSSDSNDLYKCPKNWVRRDDGETVGRSAFTCYKFVRSPKKQYFDAQELCQSYDASLATVNSNDEYGFIVRYLQEYDPLHREWYVGIVQKSYGYWENEDGSPLLDIIQQRFLPDQVFTTTKDNLAFSYSYDINEWGLKMVESYKPREFICELPSNRIKFGLFENDEVRDYEYGLTNVKDPRFLPRGPKIFHQPEDAMFDLLKSDIINYVSITCLADGYPVPTYEWFKEEFKADDVESFKINPLDDTRFTVSGGTLIINQPKAINDRGNYYCIASNRYGSVTSKSVQLSFAYMAEFNLIRSEESGNQNWGKAIYCNPPRFFPDARFYWSRDFFPNLVEEDRRTFVSFDGNLYFSYLDNIDEGKYICTVQSTVSDIGRNGPLFDLKVLPHPNFQQLKFANNFPKAFPDSPVRGNDVRLECIAFGYPVPSYNWTRRNGPLPRGAKLENNNRVLILPSVEPSDIGDYICRAENDKLSIDGTVSLSIQATPKFTIPLHDYFIAENNDVLMECEAFAIPDVTYTWLKNSKLLLANETRNRDSRYVIMDNTLRIKQVNRKDEGMYQCKATNQLGSAFSSAELKVLKLAPVFQKYPIDPEIYAAVGTNITLRCRPEAAPIPTFEWRKDGLKIGRGGRLDILPNGDLEINVVSREDRGVYNCTASNIYGSSYTSGRLIVLDRPYFHNQMPEVSYASVGGTLHLRCEAWMDELLDLTYVWTHNDLRLQVDPADAEAQSVYEENYVSDFYSRRNIENEVASDTAQKTKLLEYMVIRDPPYQRDHHPGHLDIRNVTLQDAGFYMCDARTPIANISQVTQVIIFGPPGPPGGVRSESMRSTTAILQWTDGATNGREIRNYTIQGKTGFSDRWTTLVENITATVIDIRSSRKEYELPIGSLTPWASYKFRVLATNDLGAGIYSEASPTANTPQATPFVAPRNVGGGGGKTGDLTITWQALPEEDQNGPGVYYRVFWRRAVNDSARNFEVFKQNILKERGNTNLFVAPVEERFFYTQYEVKVQSANIMGWGPVSDPVVIYSAEAMPQVQPTEVKAFAHNATSLNITWRAIEATRENIRGELIGYRLKYWREQDDEIQAQIKLKNGTEPHGLVVGLVPNTFYWVRVMAYNSAGSGPESEKFRERTWRYPPLTPPNAVEVHPIDPETIYVKWRGITPTYEEEALLGYKVRIWKSDQDMTTANDTIVPLGSALETYIYGLQIGKMYKLRVLAYSLGGDGKMSSPPWHFSMGDPAKLRAVATEVAMPFNLVCLIVFGFFVKF